MQKIWIDGAMVDEADAKVSVYDHGLLYGDGCFEGIRVYNGRIMKLRSHMDRMFESAARLRLECPYSKEEVVRAMRDTLAANDLRDAYIRLVFTRGKGTLGLNPFMCPKPTVIVIAASIQLYPPELYETGMAVVVAKRRRVPMDALDPSVKSLNYLNNILAKIESIDAGVLEAVMLNEAGQVGECTGDNIFFVEKGTIVTPWKDAGILHGITRAFVINELAPALGYPVVEEAVELERLLSADEVFLTGTAAEIIGVTKIDDRTIGDGRVGPISRALTAAYRERVAKDAPED